jgi:aminoglycoside phosphotransferase
VSAERVALVGSDCCPERFDGVMQPGLGRPDGDAQGFGRLARRETDMEVQHQDRSLRMAQAPERPVQLVSVGELRGAIGLGRLGRQDGDLGTPPAAFPPDVRAGMDDQPVQPGVESVDVPKVRKIAPRPNERVLGGILREFGVAEDQSSDPVQPIDGAACQHAEGLAVSASRQVDEFRLHGSLLVGRPIWSPTRYGGARCDPVHSSAARTAADRIPSSVGPDSVCCSGTIPRSLTTRETTTVTMADVEEVKVVVAHSERATLRVGDVFLKIDSDQSRTDVEIEAMAMAPIPTPEVLWRKPPVLALAALPGTALGRLGEPSTASSAAWTAAGAAARMLHDAPLPPWPGRTVDELASRLDAECAWLATSGLVPADLVARNRRRAEAALRPWRPVFTHGDLQVDHVFIDGDGVTGVVDWSEASQGDALYDLAILTLEHEEHLDDVVAGYGTAVDLDLVRAWWSWRSLVAIRWLVEHGFDPFAPGCEGDVLRSRM